MPELVLVGQRGGTRKQAELAGALLGFETSALLTAEAAIERARGSEGVFLTEIELPGLSGVELAVELTRLGRKVAILTARPPGLAPTRYTQLEGVPIVVPEDAPAATIVDALVALSGVEAPPSNRKLIEIVALGPSGIESLLALIDEPESEPVRALAVRHLSLAFDSELVLSALEDRVEGPGGAVLVGAALEASLGLGDGASSTLAKIGGAKVSVALRSRALLAMAERFVLDAVLPVLLPLVDDPDLGVAGAAAEAVYLAAARASAVRAEPRLLGAARDAMMLLVARATIEPGIREKALVHLAKEASPATIGPLLARLTGDVDPGLRRVASQLLVRSDGLDADGLRLIAESEARSIGDRLDALDRIAREFPEELALPMLERCQPSPVDAIAERAFELYFSAAESGWEPSLERAIARGEGAERAALLGALEHGRGALGALLGIAKSKFEPELRAAAVRMLGLRYRSGEVGRSLVELLDDPLPIIEEAARLALLHLGETGAPWLYRAATDPARSATARVSALGALALADDPVRVRAAASKLAKDPDPKIGASAVALAVTAGAVELPSLFARLAEGGIQSLQRGALEGAIALGDRGYEALVGLATHPGMGSEVRAEAARALFEAFEPGDLEGVEGLVRAPDSVAPARRKRARPAPKTDDLTISPSPDEVLDRAPTKPVPPADGGQRPPIPRPIKAHSRPRPPASPSVSGRPNQASQPLGPIPLARAEEVLRECVRQGRAGLKGLRLLALSPRVPDEVRAAAVRHLAANFDDAELGDVLVRALEGGPLVQATALGCLMVKKDVAEEPIARLAEDRSAELSVRLRATRFLPSRFGRAKVAAALLRLIECGEPQLERAALEGLFSSLRFTTEAAAELALINLLREHESLEVKTWAAQALGTFGSREALSHLEHFTGLFAEPEVKAVARRAAARIRG